MRRSLPATIIIVALSIIMTACTSTRYLAPVEVSTFNTGKWLFIAMDDDTELKLKNCVLEGDTLTGLDKNGRETEVEIALIRTAYVKKLRADIPALAGLTALTVWVTILLINAGSAAP